MAIVQHVVQQNQQYIDECGAKPLQILMFIRVFVEIRLGFCGGSIGRHAIREIRVKMGKTPLDVNHNVQQIVMQLARSF